MHLSMRNNLSLPYPEVPPQAVSKDLPQDHT